MRCMKFLQWCQNQELLIGSVFPHMHLKVDVKFFHLHSYLNQMNKKKQLHKSATYSLEKVIESVADPLLV
eukprot:c37299_g1_i1 orf=154-363(+)